MNARICLAAALSAVIILGVSPSRAADFGKPGEPVRLVVGYLPYYSGAWSAVVMRGKKMYEKYLPRGSTVEFAVSLQGPKIANAMLSGEQHIGYMGDAPAILAASKPDVADVRLVAVLGLAHDQCNIILVRNDAPRFGSPKEALQWLNGKSVAAPRESCMDRFARQVFREEKVAPAAYLDQNIEVITSGFRAGELDAAVVWEPVASRLVNEGVARRIASGVNIDEHDGGFLAMRGDLIRERPDVVTAWLNAELDAQLFLADPRNASEVVRMATEQTSGFSERDLWSALYGRSSDLEGGTSVRLTLPFVFTPEATKLLNEAAAFLSSNEGGSEKLKLEAIMPELSEQILEKRNLKSPVAEVKALAPQPLLSRTEQPDPRVISIRVERGGWGNASPAEIEPVLYSVAKELLSRFPGRPLAPIVVANSSKAPQVLLEKGRGGEYKVLLTAKGKRWGAYVYEFAHELCHVLANYERHPHHKVTTDHQWFEEALCEVSSLYTLKNLAPIWDRSPPTPQLAGEAADLRRYADRFLNEAHRKLPPNTTLAAWFKEHKETLRGSPYDRNRNEVVATLLLPLFEENPEIWEAIGFLNLDAPGDTFQDYLQNWQDNAPVKYKDVIRYAMTLFYERSASAVATRRELKFPSRPLEIIVPFGPGGGADGMARKIAQLLQPFVGVPVVVTNIPGAAGNAGLTKLLLSSDPDHTMATLIAMSCSAWAAGVGTIDPDDFTVLAVLQDSPSMLFVPADSPLQTFKDFLDQAKANPGRLRVATTGVGTQDDITLKYLSSLGYATVNVPFAKPEERYASTLEKRTDVLYEEPGDVGKYLASKQLRPLVAFSEQRHDGFRDIPTAKEMGVDIADLPNFRTLVVPAGADGHLVKVLSDAITKALESPEWKKYCAETYTCTRIYAPNEAKAHVKNYYQTVQSYMERLPR